MNPFWYSAHPLTKEQQEQLELMLDDLEDLDAVEGTKKKDPKKDPSPETGYLTCSKNCGFINPYEHPKKDWVCKGCKMWEDNS